MDGGEEIVDEGDPSLINDEMYQQLFLISGGRIDILTQATEKFVQIASHR